MKIRIQTNVPKSHSFAPYTRPNAPRQPADQSVDSSEKSKLGTALVVHETISAPLAAHLKMPRQSSANSLTPITSATQIIEIQNHEPLNNKLFSSLFAIQAEKLMPTVIAQCTCPSHNSSRENKITDHPQFIDGAIALHALTDPSALAFDSLDNRQLKLLKNFISEPFTFISIHPREQTVSAICNKEEALSPIFFTNFLLSVLFDVQIYSKTAELDTAFSMIIAAIYRVGKFVPQDLSLADALFAKEKSRNSPWAEANALILCIDKGNTDVIRALLTMGADPYQKDEDGFTFIDKVDIPEIAAGIEDLVKLPLKPFSA